MLPTFRQQSSLVSSCSFASPDPCLFSYTESDLGCAEFGELWQHPQDASVEPKGDIVRGHSSAVSFRHNQADVSEMINKPQHLREILGSILFLNSLEISKYFLPGGSPGMFNSWDKILIPALWTVFLLCALSFQVLRQLDERQVQEGWFYLTTWIS